MIESSERNARSSAAAGKALAAPWWEVTGRLTLALFLGLPGVVSVVMGLVRTLYRDASFGVTALTIGIGLLYLLAGVLAARERFLLPFLALVSILTSRAWQILPAIRGGGSPAIDQIQPVTLAFLGLCWLLLRRPSVRRLSIGPVQVTALLLAGAFLVSLPLYGRDAGKAFGTALSPAALAPTIAVGERLPNVRFLAVDGSWLEPTEPGTVYVVNFWATWCAPCLRELPEFLLLAREHSADPSVRFLAVNAEGLEPSAMVAFLESKGMTGLPAYTDTEGTRDTLGVVVYPMTLVIRDRRVLNRHEGYIPGLMETLRVEIRDAGGLRPSDPG